MRTAEGFGEIFHAGVDYLTITAAGRKNRRILVERGLRLLRKEETGGNKLARWAMLSFIGYKCGGVQIGEHDARVLVRLSGEAAKENWRPFAELHETCSRLDLQVTVRYGLPAEKQIARLFRKAKRNRHEDGKKRTVSIYQSSNGSATVYVGQRVSENYGRIYAKGLETKLPYWSNSVRFEAEFKGDQAGLELRRLLATHDEHSHVVQRCRAFFALRGCNPRWTAIDFKGPDKSRDESSAFSGLDCSRRVPDAARRLQWLSKSVRRTVTELIEAGYRDEVLVALGLCPSTQPAVITQPADMDHLVQGGDNYAALAN